MESTKLNTDGSVDKMVEDSDRSWSLDSLFEDFDGNAQLGIVSAEVLKEETMFRDFTKCLKRLFDNLETKFLCKGWGSGELSETSYEFRDNSKLKIPFSNWCKSRKELIRTTKSAAEELDKSLLMVNIARIISSGTEILYSLNLLNLGICDSITSYAYNISPYLGFIMERTLELTFQLRVFGFVYSFLYILKSQEVFRRVVNALKNDKDKFMPLKEWFDETKELDELVKNLFPSGINEKTTKSMENSLEYFEKEKKIFSATVLSNLIENPIIQKNRKFLLEAFLFSKSDTGKEWYKRFRMGAYNLDLEYEMFYLENELLQLEEVYFDSVSMLEFGKHIVSQMEYHRGIGILTKNILSNLGRLLICSMSGMSVYYCYQSIRTGSKHKYSDKLREFSTKAESFLNNMEKIRF